MRISNSYSSFHISHSYSSPSRTTKVKGKVGLNNSNFECLDDAVTLFNQMVTMKHLPSVVDISKLFKNMISMEYYSAVLSLFGEMQKLGIPISVFILNIVINSYCLMGCSDCAFLVLPIYLRSDILFTPVTFTTLIGGMFSENKVKDAIELFKKLVRKKICEPDEFIYATVINGLNKSGHTQKTFNLLRLMEQGNTKLNIYIYIIVVDALCKDENLNAAITLLNEMKQRGIPSNVSLVCVGLVSGKK
ncbi:putative pentatricopeptide repeat-containing protein At1g12700, mitochondrial [Solanum dulcamara]|uniref:putative pentatricopeptide repeat-containing protein At1g12700, mitochondrial n=1 Tax=Solanum dulcamara TaxID=45834 RepID=UPI0024855612|nr:putative pentatricopeptide repeat-containing protein At1g12700, mitochondrial [Solanum dulcamara]